MLANLLVGRHCHATTQLWQEMLFLPSVRRAEKEHRHKVEEVIEFLDLQAYREKLIAGPGHHVAGEDLSARRRAADGQFPRRPGA